MLHIEGRKKGPLAVLRTRLRAEEFNLSFPCLLLADRKDATMHAQTGRAPYHDLSALYPSCGGTVLVGKGCVTTQRSEKESGMCGRVLHMSALQQLNCMMG